MPKDNLMPVNAGDYNEKIKSILPYSEEFYRQTISIVQNMEFHSIEWLDLGCGTGRLAQEASKEMAGIHFVLADPAESMLAEARKNCPRISAEYIDLRSEDLPFVNRFDVITALQVHHYLQPSERKTATEKIYQALKDGSIYITFENVVCDDSEINQFELKRWGNYQREHGRSETEIELHLKRCGKEYFPVKVEEHLKVLKEAGFRLVKLFWMSYMQAGFYAIK